MTPESAKERQRRVDAIARDVAPMLSVDTSKCEALGREVIGGFTLRRDVPAPIRMRRGTYRAILERFYVGTSVELKSKNQCHELRKMAKKRGFVVVSEGNVIWRIS